MTVTRRRGTALEDAILDAGWAQLMQGGYTGFTFEAVADRAKTGKAALYRRWPDKESLLLAVVTHQSFADPPRIPDTGSLREDVLENLRSANRRFGHSIPALFSTILAAYFDETKTSPAQLRLELLGDRAIAMDEIERHAIERGELPGPLPPRVHALPFDLFRHEMLMTLGTVSDETIVDIVDTVFMPLATDPRRRTQVDAPPDARGGRR